MKAHYLFVLLLCVSQLCTGLTGIPYMIGYTTKDNVTDAETIRGWLGRKLDILGTTIAMTGYMPTQIPSNYLISAAVPMLTIQGWDPLNATDMAVAVAGGYDSYYTNMAKTLNKNNNLYAVRIGWEMNGNWYPWSVTGPGGYNQSPANYIALFRRMANIFRTNVPGVQIEWSTNWCFTASYGNSNTTLSQYWPGKEYVDIISMDIYQQNQGIGNPFQFTVTGGVYNLNWTANFARQQGVKVAMSEYGANSAQYMKDFITWINSLGSLFDYHVYSQYEPADQFVAPGQNSQYQTEWVNAWRNTTYANSSTTPTPTPTASGTTTTAPTNVPTSSTTPSSTSSPTTVPTAPTPTNSASLVTCMLLPLLLAILW